MAYRRWIWCRDPGTGHRFDVDEKQVQRLVKAGSVEVIPDYPVHEGPNVGPRPAKPNLDLAAQNKQVADDAAAPPDPQPTEPPSSEQPPANARRTPRTTPNTDTAPTTSTESR